MLAAVGLWQIFDALAICAGLSGIFIVLGAIAYVLMRESDDRPVLPWGARMRVERAKANLELDATEIKRLALDHHRTRIMQAISEDDHEQVQALGLPQSTAPKREPSY